MNTWWVSETDLDDDQKQVIQLSAKGRYFVIGPPGSGKTNLLLLRANYLTVSDCPNIKILVFTRALREFIVSGARGYRFPAENVQTYNSWVTKLLNEHNIPITYDSDFLTNRQNLLQGLRFLIEEEKITDKYYDSILIDEAQDYLPEEIDAIIKFSSNIFSVADARQQIWRKRDTRSIDLLKSISQTIELRHHYRNGIKICQLADHIMRGQALYSEMEPTSRYDETSRPSSVQHFRCDDLDRQYNKLMENLRIQLDAYPGERVGIVCPRNEELTFLKNKLVDSDLVNLCTFLDHNSGYHEFDDAHPICVSNIHGAKGLEFRALNIIACETFRRYPRTNRNLTFTGVTRAKTSLSIYYTGDLYTYLQSALAALSPRAERASLAEAFGRR